MQRSWQLCPIVTVTTKGQTRAGNGDDGCAVPLRSRKVRGLETFLPTTAGTSLESSKRPSSVHLGETFAHVTSDCLTSPFATLRLSHHQPTQPSSRHVHLRLPTHRPSPSNTGFPRPRILPSPFKPMDSPQLFPPLVLFVTHLPYQGTFRQSLSHSPTTVSQPGVTRIPQQDEQGKACREAWTQPPFHPTVVSVDAMTISFPPSG